MCNCKTSYEHAQHLLKEKAIYERFHREPLRYYIQDERGKTEVTREEFFAIKRNFLEKKTDE